MSARADADPDAMLVLLAERAKVTVAPCHGRFIAMREPFDQNDQHDAAAGVTPLRAIRALFDAYEADRHGPEVAP